METPSGPRWRVFICDVPNLFWSLDTYARRFPDQVCELDWGVLGQWLREELDDNRLAACVFANVRPSNTHFVAPWSQSLESYGYGVTLKRQKPLPDGSWSDIDEDMLECLDRYVKRVDVGQIFVLSRDARNFLKPLLEYARQGIDVCILGFPDQVSPLYRSPELRFIDVTQIPDVVVTRQLAL